MKYFVKFVEDSAPRLKDFKTLLAARKFANAFCRKHPDPMEGYWVDFIFRGEILVADDQYKEFVK